MNVEQTSLEGVLLIKPQIWGDSRGYFVETWQQERYAAHGIHMPFVQDNHSHSAYGTLRGLHFQKQHPQGKLVSVSLGAVVDVVVDIRRHSPSFGRWHSVELTAENQHQLWIPPGLAHGFVVTSEMAHFHYKCTDFYHPDDEGCLRWDDETVGVRWPEMPYLLSPKDANALCWKDWGFDLISEKTVSP